MEHVSIVPNLGEMRCKWNRMVFLFADQEFGARSRVVRVDGSRGGIRRDGELEDRGRLEGRGGSRFDYPGTAFGSLKAAAPSGLSMAIKFRA